MACEGSFSLVYKLRVFSNDRRKTLFPCFEIFGIFSQDDHIFLDEHRISFWIKNGIFLFHLLLFSNNKGMVERTFSISFNFVRVPCIYDLLINYRSIKILLGFFYLIWVMIWWVKYLSIAHKALKARSQTKLISSISKICWWYFRAITIRWEIYIFPPMKKR